MKRQTTINESLKYPIEAEPIFVIKIVEAEEKIEKEWSLIKWEQGKRRSKVPPLKEKLQTLEMLPAENLRQILDR